MDDEEQPSRIRELRRKIFSRRRRTFAFAEFPSHAYQATLSMDEAYLTSVALSDTCIG